MTLINCVECDRQVSHRAERCPHCGARIFDYVSIPPDWSYTQALIAYAIVGCAIRPLAALTALVVAGAVGHAYAGWLFGGIPLGLAGAALAGILSAETAIPPPPDAGLASIYYGNVLYWRGMLWYLLARTFNGTWHSRAIDTFTEKLQYDSDWTVRRERGWVYSFVGERDLAEQDFREYRRREREQRGGPVLREAAESGIPSD